MHNYKLRVLASKTTFSSLGYVNDKIYNLINSNNLDLVMLKANNNIIINLKIDNSLDDDIISLSMNTRKLCNYCLESTNNFEYISKYTDFPFPLEKIVFTISPFSNNEIKEVDCEKLIDELKKVICKSSMNIGQVLSIKIFDIRLTVSKFMFYDDEKIMERDNGFICSTTDFEFIKTAGIKLTNKVSTTNNQIFNTNFDFRELDIGGMDKELTEILRRVFISRILPLDIVKKLNVSHVKGLIMHGPPGTGKTLIARQLSKCLKAKSIKIINGPELLSKYIGESEERIRELFAEAENDQKTNDEGLHVIIFDEFDSVAVKRGSTSGVGGDVNNKIVTQLLSKIDGVDSLNNILLIGMTNRLELLDPAILRPGRFEVHVEISLPNEEGRNQILSIHTKQLYKEKCISEDVDLVELASLTKNYTGAELEGIVKEARSYAINEIVDLKNLSKKIEIEKISVKREHFIKAIDNYKPKFGSSNDNLDYYLQNGIIDYNEEFVEMKNIILEFINNFKFNEKKMLATIGIFGKPGSGKTAFTAWLAKNTNFPYIKVISNNDIAGYSESAKNDYIKDVFEQSYLSELSVIAIDSLDTIIEYYRDEITGTLRFMNSVYNLIKTFIKRIPTKKNHKLLIILNTEQMSGFDFSNYLNIEENMPLTKKDGIEIPIKELY